ncbi:MAG: DUF11 domain-containing protein, partial [Flavobacterium sp.]|nr:DUF11 domain-containing protein [Flavobacterium sp.]
MRNTTFCKSGFSRLIFLIVFLLLTTHSAFAQFYTKHYIAPAPWQYFSKANEIVISTNSLTDVDITVAKSDGTIVTTLKAKKGSPAVYRFSLLARNLPMNALNTVLNGAGLIVTSTGPTAVNLRNIASDDYSNDENRDANIKGNAALTSFGDAGLGIRFRVGYYRDGSLGSFSTFGEQRPIYSIMATANNTTIKINNAVVTTLNQGQSYLFKASIGTLVESSIPTVMNTSAAIDMPGGCGDGAFNQIPPESVLGTEYFIERGTGNDTAEQTTVVATKDNTALTVQSFTVTGVLVPSLTKTVTLTKAGDFFTFVNGVSVTNFTTSRISADKRVAVYSGTAQNCEVDISSIAPVSECGGSEFVETTKFKSYNSSNLDYFGYILLRSASEDVTINGVKTTSIAGVGNRYQIGSTGWYIINFNSEQIGRPEVLSIESKAKLTVSIVQQAGGFSMAGFFSTFASLPEDPTLTYIEGGGCTNNSARLTTQPGFDPYQWYYNGTAINGANSSTYIATKTGNYSVSYTLACGAQTPSKTAAVTLCTDLGITKTVDDTTPCIGSNVEFTVKVSNLGGNNVSGISVTDLLPSGYTYVSATPSVGVYDSTTGIWTIGDVEAQSSMTLKIVATVNASGNYTNTASLPNGVDTNTANNSASAAVNPKSANLVVTNPASVCAPSTVNLTASSVTAGSSSNLTLTYWTNQSATTALSSPNAVASSGTYYIKAVSADGCTFVKPVVVTVNTQPSAPSITSRTTNANINNGSITCFGGGSITLRATGTNVTGYLWSTGENTRDITVSTDGTYSVKVINSSNCMSDSSSAVSVSFTPAAPTASDQSFCASENKKVSDLVATGTNLKWYNAPTNGTQYPTNATLTAGNYYASQTSANGCESTRTQVKVTISASSAPVASSQSFCAADNKQVKDLIATGSNLKWYNQLTGGTQYAATQTLVTGNYYVSQTAGSCPESARTLVAVTINSVPSAPTASSQTFCATDNKTINDLTVTSGSNLKWYIASTGGSPLATTDVLTTRNYYVSQTNSCGESARTAVSVTINNTAAPTVSAQTFCSGELKKVSDLSPSGAAYKWYNASTGGTLYTGNEILTTGTYYVSQTANGCESLRTAVSVTVNQTPAAPTAEAQNFCSGENKTVNDLKVTSGSNLKWYNSSTGGTQYFGNEILTSGNYYVSQTLNGCESTRLLVSVTVNPTPAAPSISADGTTTFCQGGNVTLTSTGGSSYLWSTGATTQSITVSTSGNYSVQVTNASGCPSAFSTPVSITVNPVPSAPTASAQTFCSSENKKVSDLAATGSNLKWYNAITGGTLYAGTETLATGTYYVSQTSNGCESARASVSVTVNQTLSAPIASAQTFCSSENKKVSDLAATGSNLKWYSANTGGTLYAGTETLVTGTYYVSQTANGCESARTAVSVTVNPLPTATISGNLTACLTTTLTANSNASPATYIWYKDNVVISNQTNGTLTVTQDGAYKVKITNTSTGCEQTSAASTVKVSDTQKPVKPTLADVTGECSATVTPPTTTDNCAGTITGTTSDPLTYSTQGSYTIHWTFDDGNGNTETATQKVTIKDSQKPVKPTLTDITAECSTTVTAPTTTDSCAGTVTGTTSDPLTYNAQGTYTINWTFNDGNGNIETAAQKVIVKDTQKPIKPTLADVTGECSASVTAPTTTDNCAGTVTGTTSDPLAYNVQGTYTINWIFNDGNGNTETAAQKVIVKDTQKPVKPTLADVTGECSATVTAPTTTDSCAGTVTGTTSDPLTYNAQGTYTVNWTFNDGNGNIETAAQKVIVKDTQKPVKPTLADVTGECFASVTAPTTTDSCAGTVTGTTSDPLTYNAQGTYTVNWTFNDGNGNIETAAQKVIVKDTQKPVKPTLADVTGECSASVTAPTTTDSCAGTVTGTTSDPLMYNAQGTYTVNWTFNDGNGNIETAAQKVIVKDTQKPVKPTLADVTGECS